MRPPFISADDLARLRDGGSATSPAPVIADVRWYLDGRSGRDAYAAEHIAGAVFVDLDTVLAGEPSAAEGRHPLPHPEVFAAGMTAAGIGDDSTVIAYDDAGGVIAARLVWMLRALGVDAAVLDGGLAAWAGPRASGPAHNGAEGEGEGEGEGGVAGEAAAGGARSAFTVRPWPSDRLVSVEEVAPGVARAADILLIDARTADRYRGDTEPVDARAGHVPGAVNVSTRDHVGGDGVTVAPEVARQTFAAAGVGDGTEVVAYCGSGVTACHTLLVLEHAGYTPGRLYPGSWSQYSADPALPIATGNQP